MMSKEEAEIVKMVYNRFIGNESETWSGLDDNMELFSWLSDGECINESKMKFFYDSVGTFRCTKEHEQEKCFAPYVLEAVEAILRLWDVSGELHQKNRYILDYYLVMSELRIIYSVPKLSASS